MSWAERRKRLILFVIGAVVVAVIALTLIATFYHAPSCTDQKQDQGEQGIDCGGPCTTVCSAQAAAPSVRFVRELSPQIGRTDIIAYVDNTNANAAAKGAAYTVTLYGADNSVIAEMSGTVDLPPKSTVPIFIPDFYSGSQTAEQAFLTFASSSISWQKYTDTRPTLSVSDVVLTDGATPRITAEVGNPSANPLFNIPVVVTVFDASDNAIAASATVLQQIPAMGQASAVFTWNAPYSAVATSEQIIPLVPL